MSYVKFEFVDDHARELYGGQPPHAETAGSAGVDLRTAENIFFPASSPTFSETLMPWRVKVSTGIKVAIPKGMCGFVVPRSSLFKKTGCVLTNSPGVIDSDYRGEVQLSLLRSPHESSCTVPAGTRLAQFLLQYAPAMLWVERELGETDRADGGFGSTGHE